MFKIRTFIAVVFMLSAFSPYSAQGEQCTKPGNWLQVLGAGGPEINDGLASTSYLIWIDGQAKLLIDTGAGSHHNFELAGADFNQLDAIIYTHLHVDHSADLAAYVKSSFFTGRQRDLLLFGPSGNHLLPALDEFVERLFGKQGAWPYLSDHLDPKTESYQLQPRVISGNTLKPVYRGRGYSLSAVKVDHGPLPALAWRVDFGSGKSVTFTGDTSGRDSGLAKLAEKTQLLVAHQAIAEHNHGVARKLHMPPSVIADLAQQANAEQLLLSHFMRRSLNSDEDSQQILKRQFKGQIIRAKEGVCYALH